MGVNQSESLYRHGMARVTIAMPAIQLADPAANASAIIDMAVQAEGTASALVVFPELAITGYGLDDLFRQRVILEATDAAIGRIAAESADLTAVLLVGAPLESDGRIFNCAVVIHGGAIVGVVPKTYLPAYSEFYEARQFASERDRMTDRIRVAGQDVPFGSDLLFDIAGVDHLTLGVDVCEDLWTPIPPSTYAALAGATVLVNLSASNASVGKAEFRRSLVANHSAVCLAVQAYAGMGSGDSTTDLAWDTHSLIAENGTLLAESQRYYHAAQFVSADVDLERLVAERQRITSFRESATDLAERLRAFRRITVNTASPADAGLNRHIPRETYVPENPAVRAEHAREVLQIQTGGLLQRMRSSKLNDQVIGVSGGLDSALALIVSVRAADALGLPRTSIHAYSMPGFATGSHTRGNAMKLMQALGVDANEIDIRESCKQMLEDIGHPFADGVPQHDITFENVQAGERTSHLFRLANLHHGLVIGTGDLSELALGWCTYGVGDHMSHYSVNASVPKTLVKHLIRTEIELNELGPAANEALTSILGTPISPELIPGTEVGGELEQLSEDTVGPYDLQDFFLYYCTRYGFSPSKLRFLARAAWLETPERPGIPAEDIDKWLAEFLRRFFGTSQFKRSAIPNAPKVGNGGSLSPRGDWRAPSDSRPDVWLSALERADTLRDS